MMDSRRPAAAGPWCTTVHAALAGRTPHHRRHHRGIHFEAGEPKACQRLAERRYGHGAGGRLAAGPTRTPPRAPLPRRPGRPRAAATQALLHVTTTTVAVRSGGGENDKHCMAGAGRLSAGAETRGRRLTGSSERLTSASRRAARRARQAPSSAPAPRGCCKFQRRRLYCPENSESMKHPPVAGSPPPHSRLPRPATPPRRRGRQRGAARHFARLDRPACHGPDRC